MSTLNKLGSETKSFPSEMESFLHLFSPQNQPGFHEAKKQHPLVVLIYILYAHIYIYIYILYFFVSEIVMFFCWFLFRRLELSRREVYAPWLSSMTLGGFGDVFLFS